MTRGATGTGGEARARLTVLAGAALWGTTGTAQALGPSQATPATVGAVRLAVGGAALVAIAALAGRLDLGGFSRRGRRGVCAAAALGVAAFQVCFFAGVDRAGVAVGTVVAIGSAPMVTGLLEFVISGHRPEPRWAVATALAITGCVLLVVSGGEASVDPVGVLLAVTAGAAYAVYTLASKALLDAGHRPGETMAVTLAGGALILSPVLVTSDIGWVVTPDGLVTTAWLGLVTLGLAYWLFARGLRRLAAATVATLTLAEPLTAAVLGVTVLGERPGPLAVVGALLVLGGLVLLVVGRVASRASAPS